MNEHDMQWWAQVSQQYHNGSASARRKKRKCYGVAQVSELKVILLEHSNLGIETKISHRKCFCCGFPSTPDLSHTKPC